MENTQAEHKQIVPASIPATETDTCSDNPVTGYVQVANGRSVYRGAPLEVLTEEIRRAFASF